MEVSGKINRTAERYLEIMRHHSIELTEPERKCRVKICDIGVMAPYEILELADEVRAEEFEVEGLDRVALINKLESASFADLVATVEQLGF